MDRTAAFYARPSHLSGAGAVFAGVRRQKGGSLLGSIKSVVAPVMSRVGNLLKNKGLKNVVRFASDVVGDIVSGKNVKNSLVQRGKERAKSFARDALNEVTGRNRKQNARRKPSRNRRHKGAGRKRKASRKRSKSAKRRRRNF